MGIWSRRLWMSFIVTFGLALSRAGAQAPLVPQSQPLDPSPITPLPVLMQRPLGPGPRPAFPHANRLGYLCGGDPEWFGCGNPATQWRFVFGSCRAFFVEPCAPTPPFIYNDGRKGFIQLPPPGYGPPGYGPPGYGPPGYGPPGYGPQGGAASGGCPSCLLGE